MSTQKKSMVAKALLIITVLLIAVSILNWGVVSSWGSVRITRETIIGDNGLRYSALVYVPKEASNENKVPAIFMIHGASGNARNHEAWALEFSRRGYAVMSIDNIGAGDGEYDSKANLGNNSVPFAFYKHFMDLPFIDTDKVVISGHSMGGYIMVALMKEFASEYGLANTYLFCDGIEENTDLWPESLPGQANILGAWGLADKNWDPVGDGPRPVKTLMSAMFRLDGHEDVTEENIELDTVYGSFDEGNACMLTYIDGQIHEGVFINRDHIQQLLDFTGKSIGFPHDISPTNQIWQWKDNLGLVGMVLLACWMITWALFFIEKMPFFASIKQPLPKNIGMRKVPLAISIIAAIGFPFIAVFSGAFGLLDAIGWRNPTQNVFMVRYANVAFCLILTMNLFGLIMFGVFHFTWGKKKGGSLRVYGLTSEGSEKINWSLIGKATLLSIVCVTIGWTYLRIQGDVLGTDFYCMFWGYKPIVLNKLIWYLPYIIVWSLCFIVASLGMNVERRLPSTGNETKDTVLQVIFNIVVCSFTITFIVLLETIVQHHLGYTAKALPFSKTDITRIWGMPCGLIIGVAGNSYLFRKTGNVYLGALLMGTISALGACLYGQLQF